MSCPVRVFRYALTWRIAVTGHGLGGALARWRRARSEREEPSDVEILRQRYSTEAETSPAGHATELPGAGEQGTAERPPSLHHRS